MTIDDSKIQHLVDRTTKSQPCDQSSLRAIGVKHQSTNNTDKKKKNTNDNKKEKSNTTKDFEN